MPNKVIRTRLQLIGLALVCAFGTAIAQAQAPAKPEQLPTGDPCTILPLAAVQKAFPDAKAGERRRDIEKYGVTECRWSRSKADILFGVQEFYAGDTALEEAQSRMLGLAKQAVRYEKLSGLGAEAVAVVEPQDPKRGIPQDTLQVFIHKGQRTVTLGFWEPPQGTDRAATLKLLETLGRIAAKRLD